MYRKFFWGFRSNMASSATESLKIIVVFNRIFFRIHRILEQKSAWKQIIILDFRWESDYLEQQAERNGYVHSFALDDCGFGDCRQFSRFGNW